MVVITSTANPAVKAARKLLRRQGRARAGDAFLVEGPQAVAQAGAFLRQLFVTPQAAEANAALIDAARVAGAEILNVSDEVLAELSDTVTPQGLVGVAAVPGASLDHLVGSARLLVVLHQVRDPGNAGTAIRTADAAGADGVVFTSGSVDAHNPKAVRSSVGSVFHLPLVAGVGFSTVAQACQTRGIKLVGAAGDGPSRHTDVDLSGPVALVFGNEAHGLDAHVVAACDEVVRIPMFSGVRDGFTGAAESLNLAATVAVLTFEAARQQAPAVPPLAHGTASTR